MLEKYKRLNGKYVIPLYIIRNMENYISLFKLKYQFFSNTGILNIYVNSTLKISFYTTKNFANIYYLNRKIGSLKNWESILLYLSKKG